MADSPIPIAQPTDADGSPSPPVSAVVLLLGTFHFQDRGLDAYRPRFAVDILSPERQREIEEIADRLATFRPTKVAVERHALWQAQLDAEYAAYRKGTFALPADEVYQLGFRLAGRCGHSRVYGVNAWDRHYEPWGDLDAYAVAQGETAMFRAYHDCPAPVEAWARAHGQDHLLAERMRVVEATGAAGDRRKTEVPLRETLRAANAEAAILRGHGAYLVGLFEVGAGGAYGAYPGPDHVTAWYNRNLRIFANLQRLTESSAERLLLVIGGGHVPILRHCVQASPAYELAEVHDYL